jgi:hypothetical protein
MTASLIPCPSCSRHVFTDACTCPFCATRLRVCEAPRAMAPAAGLSRAARVAAGAALVGVAACGSGTPMPRPPYGAPPPVDASMEAGAGAGGDAGAQGGAGGTAGPLDASPSDATSDRSVAPIYGAAAPVTGKPVR